MTLGEIKDVVREHFGRMGLPTVILDLALAEGRKLIEREANFWWMRATTTFNLVIDTQDYLIGSTLAVNIVNFKDARALNFKKSTETRWRPLSLGIYDQEELDVMYPTDSAGAPELAIVDNTTLKIYPPKPDLAYNMKLYHYNWTDNPVTNILSDDITKNYGMALIYAAIIWGYEIELKDMQGAIYWRKLLGGEPFGRGGEITKLKRQNLKRDWQDKIVLVPHAGANSFSVRTLANMQGYGR